ncbi:hypothetical protein GWN26_09125 [Candidatus Saccharibacteria bacterium]|nr:hypothetical protein [Candidatus Saccharibacteria bacterium]NIS52961.1 hypothetical protein [Phycisphaerae bacterium]NIV03939.1 hypothetical protein [Calditrichia bacterium]NIV72298.1 hypothetical protein [Calditrichia bacterium]NIV99281.1 hypothetical protein [Candidatus Saccharibacteria bacterium]
MKPKKSHIFAIKRWLKLSKFAAGHSCPFKGEKRNVGTVTGARVCADIFPEIKPDVDNPYLEDLCGFCCPCGLLDYQVVRERAKKYVDSH